MQLMNDGRFNRFARWESTTLKILGSVMAIFAILLCIPLLFTLLYGEDPAPFVYLIPTLFVIGMVQFLLFRESKTFHTVHGLMLVILAWALVFIIGMIPYKIAGMSALDAMFESVSGLTSTGGTVMTDVTAWPGGILAWRGMTQWIGGIAVIIIFMYILPLFGMGRNFFRNELAGSGSSEYSVKMKNAAKSFVFVYLIMTLVNFVLLLIAGENLLNAFVLSMTTISTGGFFTTNDSLASCTDLVQIITICFMFLGGANFYLHYRALYKREEKVYRGNSEFKYYIYWIVAISVIIYLMILSKAEDLAAMTFADHYEVFKNVSFTVVSLGTSTAFTVTDYGTWPALCILLLMIVAFIGGCSGSTAGGVKFGRLVTIYHYIKMAMHKTLRPSAVVNVKYDGQVMDNAAVVSALSIFLMYIITMFVGAMVIMAFGYNFVDSFGLSIGTISDIGLGFGNYGPSGSWAYFSPGLKIFLMIMMWVGRLEIMIVLLFFTPSYWREFWLEHRAKKKEKRSGY